MITNRALLVFVKNPALGKVKTRLAAYTSDEFALDIYLRLLQLTSEVVQCVDVSKFVFYADAVPNAVLISKSAEHFEQRGNSLGERMRNAFESVFSKGFHQAVIIGSDCAELQPEHLESAFEMLNNSDIVIGPATDGGYYLLGMNQLHEELFIDISWSSSQVLTQTLQRIEQLKLKHALLQPLTDIDELKDLATLPAHWKIQLPASAKPQII